MESVLRADEYPHVSPHSPVDESLRESYPVTVRGRRSFPPSGLRSYCPLVEGGWGGVMDPSSPTLGMRVRKRSRVRGPGTKSDQGLRSCPRPKGGGPRSGVRGRTTIPLVVGPTDHISGPSEEPPPDLNAGVYRVRDLTPGVLRPRLSRQRKLR